MDIIKKIPTEKEMLNQLRRGRVLLPPLSFRYLKNHPNVGGKLELDAMIEASWGEKKARFAVECKSLSTPKVFRDSLNLLKSSSLPKNCHPMLLRPFLNELQLQELDREGISGIDLCGNGVVIVAGVFAVFRSGEKNRFSSSASIKNIYRKNSSMVGRVFLVRSDFDAVQEIGSEINRRNLLVNRWGKKPMSLSTVSKSLKTLVGDLIVERNDILRLLQPDRLLEKLSGNYTPPYVTERISLKVSEERGTIQESLAELSEKSGLPIVAAGISSVAQYAVMQRGEMLSVYCPRLESLMMGISGNQSDRFPNLELIETDDESIYFDAREERGFWWASPVQVYLELMAGDKRDQETAEQVKSYIMSHLQRNHQ